MQTLKQLEKTSRKRERLKSELDQARADAARLMAVAKRAGIPVTEIAKAAGLSRFTVYETLKRLP